MGGETNPTSSAAAARSGGGMARDEFPMSPSASAGSTSTSASSPPTPAELARIAQQEALMDRLMERKLALLEAEYNACLQAEDRARQQQGGQTTADEAAMHGYGRVGGGREDAADEEEEFSPAWSQFKRDMEEERLRQATEGGAEAGQAAEGKEAAAEESKTTTDEALVHAPLTSDKIVSIKSVMSGIKLRPPAWAVGMSEEQWMARILERAGFVRRAAAAKQAQQQSSEQQQPQQQEAMSEEERRRRREKKRARKAKRAAEAKQQQQQQQPGQGLEGASLAAAAAAVQQQTTAGGEVDGKPSAVGAFADDFDAAFPALPSPPQTAATSSATSVADSVTQTA